MSRFLSLAGLRQALVHPVAMLAAGVLHTAAFAPGTRWGLQLLALLWLFAALSRADARRSFWQAGAFALAWLGSGIWWIWISLHHYGHLPALLSAAAVLLLAAFLALFYALPFALLGRWRTRRRWGAGVEVLALVGTWLAAELARAQAFTGFPWLASGYAHTDSPLRALAPWVGVYGLSAVAALLAACLALAPQLFQQPRARWVLTAPALVLAALWLPQDFTHSTGSLRVSLVQPNVPQSQKFDPEHWGVQLKRMVGQIERAQGDLVITPESVLPVPLLWLPPEQAEPLHRAALARPVLLGSFLGNADEGFVNSMVGLGLAQPYAYGKRHLLPFGEFIPPGFAWFVRALNIPMDSQASGQHQRPLLLQGQHLRPLICYEDLFGEDFAVSALAQGEAAATVFINASNLAWFGPRMVQDQHLQFSRMRALEFQRPFVRATNTGATAHVDHQGQVLARLPAETAGVLEVQVQGRSGATPYARWLAAAGLWPLWVAALLLLAPTLVRRAAPSPAA
ncbi:apolipoprotein N-acyltransferase [Roseateles sp. BYS180W]|uniref:Apolipoprotein N-acyltransferase n=1 Tax=Roseateles rivi TaxID=3299028 RepID=A0ABW7FWX7_9BURK